MADARTNQESRTAKFLEKIGNRPIELDDFKVDQLRAIASDSGVTGSHDLHKPELVEAINKKLGPKS